MTYKYKISGQFKGVFLNCPDNDASERRVLSFQGMTDKTIQGYELLELNRKKVTIKFESKIPLTFEKYRYGAGGNDIGGILLRRAEIEIKELIID